MGNIRTGKVVKGIIFTGVKVIVSGIVGIGILVEAAKRKNRQ